VLLGARSLAARARDLAQIRQWLLQQHGAPVHAVARDGAPS